MALNWYFEENEKQQGPFEEEAIKQIISEGKITSGTLVWNEKMDNWTEAINTPLASQLIDEELPIIKTVKIPPTVKSEEESEEKILCVNCNNQFSKEDLVEIDGGLVCAECKPIFIRKLQEGGSVNSIYYHYAGFWIRGLALFIDGVIMGVVQWPLGILFGVLLAMSSSNGEPNLSSTIMIQGINFIINLLLALTYSAWFVSAKSATPGKMILGLKIINADGNEKISLPKAIGRHFAKVLNGFTFNIGYMMAGWDDEKRGLHDRLCTTRVIYKK